MGDRFLTVRETAQLLRMSEAQVYRDVQAGYLPGRRLRPRGKILIDRTALDQVLTADSQSTPTRARFHGMTPVTVPG